MTAWVRVMGIDPGFRVTGYGVIDTDGQQSRHVSNGVVVAHVASDPGERLRIIFDRVSNLVAEFSPAEMAVERVFVHRNVDSALKLGQARAAAICASFSGAVTLHEYAAREVKLAVVGKGNAGKEQVAHMVRVLLGLRGELQSDAADALGVALCHAHRRGSARRLQEAMA